MDPFTHALLVTIAVTVVLTWKWALSPDAIARWIRRDPKRWPELDIVDEIPRRLRSASSEALVAELRRSGFVEVAARREATPTASVVSRTFYSAERATYASLSTPLAMSPRVELVTGFDDGTIVRTGAVELAPERHGAVIDHGVRGGTVEERLVAHDRLIEWWKTAYAHRREPIGIGTIEERLLLARRYYEWRFRGEPSGALDSLAEAFPAGGARGAGASKPDALDARLGVLDREMVYALLPLLPTPFLARALGPGALLVLTTLLTLPVAVLGVQNVLVRRARRAPAKVDVLDAVPASLRRGRAKAATRQMESFGFEAMGAISILRGGVRTVGRVLRSSDGTYAMLFTLRGAPRVELWTRLGDGTIVRTGTEYEPVTRYGERIVSQGSVGSVRGRMAAHGRCIDDIVTERGVPRAESPRSGGAYRGRTDERGVEAFAQMVRAYYAEPPSEPAAARAHTAAPVAETATPLVRVQDAHDALDEPLASSVDEEEALDAPAASASKTRAN